MTTNFTVRLSCAAKNFIHREVVPAETAWDALKRVLNKKHGEGRWSRHYLAAACEGNKASLSSDGVTTIRGHGDREFAWNARVDWSL